MRVIGAIVLIACLGGIGGCGMVADPAPGPGGSGELGRNGGTASVTADGSGAASSATPSRYSSRGADILFAQMTLLHHQQTVALADLMTTKTGIRPEVRAIAQRLRALEEPDIPVLRGWLREWNAPDSLNLHSGHPMKGILTDVELGTMETLDGSAFESQWLVRMIAHQDGAALFAGSVVRQTQDERVRVMARSVIQTMPSQVVELQALR
jgi:uncharacterized protein (DUF305 family)